MIWIENWTKKNAKCNLDDAPVCVLFQVWLTILLLLTCLQIIQQCPKNNEAKQLWEWYHHEANQSGTQSCKENRSRTHTTLVDKWIEGEQEDMIMAVEASSHCSFSSSQTILHHSGDFTCPIYDWGHAKEANWVLFFLSDSFKVKCIQCWCTSTSNIGCLDGLVRVSLSALKIWQRVLAGGGGVCFPAAFGRTGPLGQSVRPWCKFSDLLLSTVNVKLCF